MAQGAVAPGVPLKEVRKVGGVQTLETGSSGNQNISVSGFLSEEQFLHL